MFGLTLDADLSTVNVYINGELVSEIILQSTLANAYDIQMDVGNTTGI